MMPSLAYQERGANASRFHASQARPMADALKLHHLRTPRQIASVLHLRGEIDLSVHAAAGQEFIRLEKKETTSGSSSGSNRPAS